MATPLGSTVGTELLKAVSFDEASTMIKFRVVDPAVPSMSLTEPTGEWIPSEFGEKFPTDDALWKYIRTLSNGKP